MPRTRAQTKAQEEARTKLLDLPPEQLEAIAGCLCPHEFVLFLLLARACREAVTTPAAVQARVHAKVATNEIMRLLAESTRP